MSQSSLIACDPSKNVVVEACAGSGKTWMLTSRVFRLLLQGAKPSQILAITFTRKAAMEMRERLSSMIKECAVCSSTDLEAFLECRGVKATPANCAKARALAGQVLTSGRGLAIDTFHGWFTSLCQMAPLGCGFSRQAEPTDQTDFWRALVIEQFIAKASDDKHELSAFKPQLDQLARTCGRDGLVHLLTQVLNNWVSAWLWVSQPNPVSLEQVFQIDDQTQWPGHALNDSLTVQNLLQMARWLGQGTGKQQRLAEQIETVVTEFDRGAVDAQEAFEQLWPLFFTQSESLRKATFTKSQSNGLAGVGKAEYLAHWEALGGALSFAKAKAIDVRDYELTVALRQLLPALLESYQALKTEHSVCDFDDLEATAVSLLMDENQRAYMQQKLDDKIKHILVDEFQDTNPVQWSILRHWLEDYAPDSRPSVFLVGDPKQSIYRFRRAESRLFKQATEWLAVHFDAVVIESDNTRRCSPEVVDVVNAVFQGPLKQGSTPFRLHGLADPNATRNGRAGLVMYPPIDPKQPGPSEAQSLVQALQAMRSRGEIQQWGQVLVLVRSHRSAVDLVPALRQAGLPYQLKDQGERYSSLIWSDTLALFSWLGNVSDHFSLLQLLRSPLFALGSDHLAEMIRMAVQWELTDVWAVLQKLVPQSEWAGPVVETLQSWLACARSQPLFEVICLVERSTQASLAYLNRTESSQRFLFAAHWEWLKAWALQINKGRFPSVACAVEEAERLARFGGSDGDFSGANEDVLRIFTVHSAKGLEADCVWLFDAGREPRGGGLALDLLQDWPLEQDWPSSLTLIDKDSMRSPARQSVIASEAQALLDEQDHLLYVALTRARRQVHVSGTLNQYGRAAGWLERLAALNAPVLQWPELAPRDSSLPDASAVQSAREWVRSGMPSFKPVNEPIGFEVPNISSPELRMGTALHAVLEYLDELKYLELEAFWRARWLDCEAQLRALSPTEYDQMQQAFLCLINKPELKPWLLEAKAAWNELEWVSNNRLLRADRVVQTDQGWWVLDYKWNVNASNQGEYADQVREYMGHLQVTLAQGQHQSCVMGALIDRHGQVYEVSWV